MASMLSVVSRSALALLGNKVWDKTTENLKDGRDVADEAFRNLIVREIEDIKTKLNGLARKDLLASIDLFKAGILNLNQVFEKTFSNADKTSEGRAEGAASGTAVESTSAISHATKQTDLNESAKGSLADAVDRFRSTRLEATRAFNNKALTTCDRVLALKFQLMAIILERVDRPADAVDDCKLCLENLHAMAAVRDSFKVQLARGLRSLFNNKEREPLFVSVYQANHVVFRLIQMTKGSRAGDTMSLPCVDIGDESRSKYVHVLRDEKVVKQLRKFHMVDVCIGFQSFTVDQPSHGIATNTLDQIIILAGKAEINVYDPSGRSLYSPSLFGCHSHSFESVVAIATDRDDKLYALVKYYVDRSFFSRVDVWDQHGNHHHSICLSKAFSGNSLTVNDNNQVFVLLSLHVQVYNTEGLLTKEFGKGILSNPSDITTAANDGRVLILDGTGRPQCVHTFSADGDHLQEFTLQSRGKWGTIMFDCSSETVVVSLWESANSGIASIYTVDGEFLRVVPLPRPVTSSGSFGCVQSVAVTSDGRLVYLHGREVRVSIF